MEESIATTVELLLSIPVVGPYVPIVTAVIALASAVTAITKTPKAGTTLAKVYKVIDLLAVNIGKAKDKGDPQ